MTSIDTSSCPVAPGEILAEKYVVERVLGVGGMGVVVSARHLQLDELVALKFLIPQYAANEEAVERFLREAKAAVRLKSEHGARIIDIGTLETGSPYMVMEYLHGSDVSDVLAREGQLSVEVALDYIIQASEAVAEAHALNIVHRDLKPSNLFLTTYADGAPLVKVLDFGISKILEAKDQKDLTSTLATMGSPAYMSPEQIRNSKSVDTRTDVWSLGVILYELLTGQTPFRGDSATALLASIVVDAPHPLRDSAPDVPAELESVILRCLEKDPVERTPSVAAFCHGLLPFAPRKSKATVERILNINSSQPERIVLETVPPPRAFTTDPTLNDIGLGPARAASTSTAGTLERTLSDVSSGVAKKEESATVGSWSQRRLDNPSRPRWPVGAALGGLAVVAVVLSVWWLRRPTVQDPASLALSAGVSVSAPSVSASSPSVAEEVSVVAPEPAASASASAQPSAAVPGPTQPPPVAIRRPPREPKPAAASGKGTATSVAPAPEPTTPKSEGKKVGKEIDSRR